MSSQKKIDHSARAHALLSASGSSRWMNCTPSPVLESKFESHSSFYGEEGTLAHEFAELNLKLQLSLVTKTEYNKLVKPFKANLHYSGEMETEVQKHVDYVIQQFTEAKRLTKDSILMIEQKVNYSEYVEEGFGTCDDVIIADRVLEVIDLKYGKGIRVSAKDNPQLKLYGLGALCENEILFDIDVVRLTIVQPRLDSISSWEISVKDLKEWAEKELKPKAKLAFKGKGELNSGEWCRFCKAAPRCSALAKQSLEVAKEEFSDPKVLTDNQLIEAYKKFSTISSWMKEVSSYLLAEALAGKTWPEHKLVQGRSNRVWTDTERIEEILKKKKFSRKDYLSQPSLLGIGAIEKLVGKDKFHSMFESLYDKPPGKPTLVPETDRRPEFSVSDAKSDFSE